jgi:ATP-dependent DNA helicase RecQ
MTVGSTSELHAALHRYFGFEAFRAEQEVVVRRAVEGRDTLAVMPTGAGKSLCYQLAAMLRPTPTLVVSPLIALMKDQIDNLPSEVARHASLINSSLEPAIASRRLRSLAAGDFKLIYAAPERLRQRNFVEALRAVDIGLVVIDEVHCVSMWGHDFRPDYLFIRHALEALSQPAVLGLTATAAPATARDISESLGRGLEIVRTSVVRTNLRYEVEHVENEEEKLRATLRHVMTQRGSGIVYARSREKCEQIARLLYRNGVRAMHYHAKLEPFQRTQVQERFLQDRVRAIVATTAFGMGIDKPDVRWVVLYNFPDSLEDYVQRVGRAGRDGLPSTCTLLVSQADASSLKRFAAQDIPTVERLRSVYRVVRNRQRAGLAEVTPEELREEADLPDSDDPRVLIGMLERTGLLRRDYDAGRAMRIDVPPPPADAAGRIEALLSAYAEQAQVRARRMIAFAGSARCRHLQVAEHFGESVAVPCGMCDVCTPLEHALDGSADAAGRTGESGEKQRMLPEDIGRTIFQAVQELSWPLGIRGLAAMLRGSVDAPPSAQRSPNFGVLEAARDGTVKRWIGLLIETGNLEQYESPDGYRLLRVADPDGLPHIYAEQYRMSAKSASRTPREAAGFVDPAEPDPDDIDEVLFEQLREWRREKALSIGKPSYIVAPDRTLRAIAAVRPASPAALSAIDGIGPAKLALYGEEILALVHTSTAIGPDKM